MRRSRCSKKAKNRKTLLRTETLEPRLVLDSGGGAGQLTAGTLIYNNGPLLANVNLVPIYLQDSASSAEVSSGQQSQFNAFLSDLAGNGYLTTLVGEYSVSKPKPYTIGNGTLDATSDKDVQVTAAPYTPTAGGTTYQAISDSQIQTTIQNEINAHRTAAPNVNNLYIVFTPPGDVVTSPGIGDSISNFVGYHSSFTDSAANLDAYAVIPYSASPNNTWVTNNQITTFQAMTQPISHEVAEAVSDTDPVTGWANPHPVGGGENGDQASGEDFTMDGYVVQYEWSNKLVGPAHALGTGSDDLFINQLSPPATTGFSGGPIATFTTANHSLTAADFTVKVYARIGTSESTDWTTAVSGGNGFFTINATPPAALAAGQVGTPLQQNDGLNVFVWDKAAGGPSSGAPMSYRYQPFKVQASAPLIYNADQGGVAHNFILKENTATKSFELTDNGLLVFTQPISQTTSINIGADPGIDASLTIDYSGGVFQNHVTFDGGSGTKTHTLTLTGGTFASDEFATAGPSDGDYALDGQTIDFLNVNQTNDLTAATNFTAPAQVGNIVSAGPSVNGVQTQTLNGGGGFLGVNFANKSNLVGPYLLVSSGGSTPNVLHVQMGPNADNLTLEVDPGDSSNIQVFQNGVPAPLGQFTLASFASIQANGSGTLMLDYGNGSFGKPINDSGTAPATLAIANSASNAYQISGNTTTVTVNGDATNVVTATNVQVVLMTGQPHNLLEMAGETCVFTAEAANVDGQPLTAKWQFSSDGSVWTDVTDPVTNLTTDAGERTRLTFEMTSSKKGQYRAAFSADGGTSYAYSRAANLTYAAPELGNVTYWIGGGETGGPAGGPAGSPTVGDPTAWSQSYNWTNGVPDSTKIAVFVSKTDTTPWWSKPIISGNATWSDDHPVNTNCVVDGNFSVGGLYLAAGWDDTLTVNGKLDLVLGGEWDSGTINIAEDGSPTAAVVNDVGAHLVLNNVNPVALVGGGTLLNDGVIIQTGNANNLEIGCQYSQGDIYNASITMVDNAPGGVFDIQTDASIIGANELNITDYTGNFRNRGLLEKTGGTTTTGSTIDTRFSSWGTIEVDQGKLIVNPAGIPEATVAAGPDPANYYNSNNFVVNGGAIFDPTGGNTSVLVTGTLTGSGSGTVDFSHGDLIAAGASTLNFPGDLFHWSGGVLKDGSSNGTEFTWTNTGKLNITAGSELFDATLHNQGDIVQTAADSLKITTEFGKALLDNQAGATFELASPAGLSNGYYPGSFLNNGILLKSDASTSTIAIGFTNVAGVNGQGVIHVEKGTLVVKPTGTAYDVAGNLEPANYVGANNPNDPSFIVDSGADLDPTGGNAGGNALGVTGTLTGSGSGTVDLSHGMLSTVNGGGATLNFPETMFQWTGGSLNGGKGDWTNSNVVTIAGDVPLFGTLQNQATINQKAGGNLHLPGGSMLDNQAGAIYDLQADVGIVGGDPYAYYTGVFKNDGDLKKTGATTATGSTVSTSFVNEGTIDVEQGKLSVAPDDGTLTNSGTITVRPSTTLAVGGNYAQTATGTLQTDLGGAGSFGQISVTGSATLDGTLSVILTNNYTPAWNDTFPVLTFSSKSGDFATKNLPALPKGPTLVSSFTASELDVFVQPLSDAAAKNITPTEGQAFSNTALATFGDPGAAVSDLTASINWGDGKSSDGTVNTVAAGRFAVDGSHTYAEQGTQSVVVTIQDTKVNATATVTGTATVAEAPISAQGVTFSAVEATSFTKTIATFTDPDKLAVTNDYSATIDWGDKSAPTTVGAADIAGSSGNFTVPGSHTYAEEGTFTVTATVADGSTNLATAHSTVQVADAPLSGTSASFAVTTTINGTVGSFSDPDTGDTKSDYAATIDWGDGKSSDGTIAAGGGAGQFNVTGSHTYSSEEAHTITVTVSHGTDQPLVIQSLVARPLSVHGVTFSATEAASVTQSVATFTDPNTAHQPSDYSATIDWGDGKGTSKGVVSGPDANGVFTVTGSHAYGEEIASADTVKVVISRTGSPDATVTDSANVADAALLVTSGSLSGSAGASLSGTLATFTDPGGAEPLADYRATVDWGDQSTAVAGTISGPDSHGVFTISGSHTYAAAGTEAITITLHHDAVAPDATINSTASITGPVSFNSTGGEVTVRVANGDLEVLAGTTIASSTPLDDVTSLTVNGATGTANKFTLEYTGGTFVVPGGITFNGGTLPATPSNSLSILGGSFDVNTFDFQGAHDGSIQLGTSGQLVNYTNMTPLANTGTAAQAVFNLPDGTVAASLDAGQTAGTVELVSGNGSFETTTFPAPTQSLTVNAGKGSDTVTTTNAFYSNFDSVLTVEGAANTLPLHTSATSTITATAGTAFTDALATFVDPNGAGAANDYSATINWGDGATADTGSIALNGGRFTVSGTHTYAAAGTMSPVVTIEHGSATPATATATVDVASGTPFATSDAVYTIGAGTVSVLAADGLLKNDTAPTQLSVTVGTFTGAQGGTFTFNADGSFTYTPAANFPGYDSAPFTVTDASGDKATQTVTVLSQHAGVVSKFYESVLNRTPDPAGLQYWTNYFDNGGKTGDMAFGFFESDELLNKVLSNYYEQYLQRPLDADGLAYWKGVWHATGGPEQIKAGFADSPEFYTKSGGTSQDWITALYQRILNRPPDPSGQSFWLNYYQQQTAKGTDAGQVRYNIALAFFDSAESYGQDVVGWFEEYLMRAPTDAEKMQYANEMEGGASDRTIEQEITNLPEYASNPPGPATSAAAPLPNFYQMLASSVQAQAAVAAKDAFFGGL